MSTVKYIIVCLFILLTLQGIAQEVKFRERDQKVEVYRGSQVEIMADTAFVISMSRAKLLNEKLDELRQTRESNAQLQSINQELLSKIKEVEKLVAKLLVKMQDNEEAMNLDLSEIVSKLDASLVVLRQNNEQLEEHNKNLNQQISALESAIKTLKKEIRGIWWNGVVDKIAVGAAALVLGFFLGSVT